MYFAYCYSSMQYGMLFWGNLKNFEQIFELQEMAIRLIANVSNATSCKPCFSEIRIMMLPSIYTLKFSAYKNVPN